MIKTLFHITIIFILLTSKAFSSPIETMKIKYGFYTGSFNALKKTTSAMEPIFVFPSIPGSIFGNPSKPVLFSGKAHNNTLEIRLPKNIDDVAQALSEKGLSTKPQNTKILRLGTFHVNPEKNEQLGGGGFVDTNTNNLIILVYVSQSSQITGTLEAGDEKYIHDITFKKPGWNWIETKKLDDTTYSLKNYSGDIETIEFTVIVEEDKAI